MNNYFQDEETLPLRTMMLASEQIDQALQSSEAIADPVEQWQVYLHCLARLGVQQWLQTRVPRLTCTVLPNQNLQVGAFQIGIAVMGSLTDESIAVPRSEMERGTDFWVWVEVLEELEQVTVWGYLRQEELVRQGHLLQQGRLIPIDCFNLNTDDLLLYVQHWKPARSSVLIDVRHWLQERIDELAQDLSWVLLPPPTYVSAMRGGTVREERSPVEQFDAVMADLIAQGMEISSQARGAYRDVQLGEERLRLYVVIWKVARSNPIEWTLLVILGSQVEERLPANVKLRIRDETQLLDEQVLPENQAAAYLYSQAFGVLNERLWVAIETSGGEVLMLPPFTLSEDKDIVGE
jgi:Protein of unknown function (DUF1822)